MRHWSMGRNRRGVSKLQKKFVHGEDLHPGPILESKGICAIFQEKGKKGKIFESLGKNVKNLKIF